MTTVPPSREEMEIARVSGRRLSSLARLRRPLTIRVCDINQDETIDLPADAVKLLVEILEDMAAGRGVTIMSHNAELTIQQAADFLNVSRPFLIQLLEAQEIPFRKAGAHRRIRLEDVLRYKEAVDTERRKVLDTLAAEAQELDMGY